MVSLTPEFIYQKILVLILTHPSPGKQLAADLLRIIMAHFLLNFDIRKCDEDVSYPPMEQRGMSIRQRKSSA
jgi:cytochrome P450 monooxygenase